MKTASYFIEVVRYYDGSTRSLRTQSIRLFEWQLSLNEKFGITTIAVFKIYPK